MRNCWFIIASLLLLFLLPCQAKATGEAATYFEIYLPPNNDATGRDVVLVITAIYDSTRFDIVDDDADGDNDDSVSGMLMAGQSYLLYMREGAVNDDQNHSGESGAKADGDFFIITTNNLVFASQATRSSWQHDWVPATNKTARGSKFIVYGPPPSRSDLNVYAYEDSTVVTIRRISTRAQQASGYTSVDIRRQEVVAQRTLDIGQDLIFYHRDGQQIMEPGHTYLVETSKPVTMQYGALHKNARDGGGYVPSANGSSSGELFYFTVHFQSGREQEIRIVSWDSANQVTLDYFKNGAWQNLKSWELNQLQPGDWVSSSGDIRAVFRIRCAAGKKVSVFEANWLETGSPGTSDIGTMLSSREGNTAGREFLAYMPPPGREVNAIDPFTGLSQDFGSHAFLFARDTARVTVTDAYTQGQTINRSYTLLPGRYADCKLDLAQWRSIYNGNGSPNSGPERPYLLITSDRPISVFLTNFNDNWMTYFGTSQTQDFGLATQPDKTASAPGEKVKVVSDIIFNAPDSLKDAEITVIVSDGATVVDANLHDRTAQSSSPGTISPQPGTGETKVSFGEVTSLDPNHEYETETEVELKGFYNDGSPIPDNTVISLETVVSGTVDGNFQQASSSSGVQNQTDHYVPELFFPLNTGDAILTDAQDNLALAFGDYDNDGLQDVFVPAYQSGQFSALYRNLGNRRFEKITNLPPVQELGSATGASWGDSDNDGDLDLFVSFAGSRNQLYLNDGNGGFTRNESRDLQRYTGQNYAPSWIDYDGDGDLDVFVAEFLSDRPNLIFRNEGDGEFVRRENVFPDASYSLGAGWGDYDTDGDMDLYVPNANGENNFLYRNDGGGTFVRIDTGILVTEGGHSLGCSWGDFDNDGDFDLYVTNGQRQANFFYQNDGNGRFSRINSGAAGVERADAQGSTWGDFNNDGWLDLYVTQGDEQRHRLFLNYGDGGFDQVENEPVSRLKGFMAGTATADLDLDGDLDLMVAGFEGGENALFSNNSGGTNHWFALRLIGRLSNLNGIGAIVRLRATIDGTPRWQSRFVSGQTGGGAGGQNSLILHFGLGDAAAVDSLLIIWPSGFRQFETNLRRDNLYTIEEQSGKAITGRVYFDADSSCSFSNGDTGIPGQKLLVQPGDRYLLTDSSGRYSVSLQDGTYTVAQVPNAAWTQLCPVGPSTYTVDMDSEAGSPVYVWEPASDRTDCSWGCEQSLSGSGNTVLNQSRQVCIEAGETYSGGLTFNRGGTLVICGTANFTNLNFNGNEAVTVIISQGATVSANTLSLNRATHTLINYSDAFSIANLNLNQGSFENHGSLSLAGINLNRGAQLLNTGSLSLGGNLVVNDELLNYGSMLVSGNVIINGDGRLENNCRLVATGDLAQNGELSHRGYLAIGGQAIFNSSEGGQFAQGSRFTCNGLTVNNGKLEGPPLAHASVEVNGNTILNSGSMLTGHLYLCDADGIETMYGILADQSTIDCGGIMDSEPCYDGLAGNAYEGYDFGNQGICQTPDLIVSIATTGLRRGFLNDYVIKLENRSSALASNIEVEAEFSTWLDIQGMSQAPSESFPRGNGLQVFRWELPQLGPLETHTLTVTDSVLPEVPFGVSLTSTAWINSPGEADCQPADNQASSTEEVVGSYDPNDKQAWPKGFGDANYILASDTIHYKIRFQNVGNFMASRVVVYDTLSANLDPTTFVQGPLSHDGSVRLTDGNVLIWTFDNINLPDSISNEPESHGFILFDILPKQGLAHGTPLINGAAIQFDFNELIYTNRVLRTIADRASFEQDWLLEMRVFPNPVTDVSTAMVTSLEEGLLPVRLDAVEILDPSGRIIRRLPGRGSSQVRIDGATLAPGLYLIRGYDLDGNRYIGKMVVE